MRTEDEIILKVFPNINLNHFKYAKADPVFSLYEIEGCIKEGIKLGEEKARKEFIAIINNANIEVSNEYFNERCENCNKNIDASIHHYIDSFYKKLQKQEAKK